MRGVRATRETTAIESGEKTALPLRLPQSHGRHDDGGTNGFLRTRVQSAESA